jgi:protoporphyrinogen oxidase
VVVVGGGPAGLAAARELAHLGVPPLVLEKSGTVGGLARTESYRGFRFDVGGHRFFTKSPTVERIWRETLGSELLRRKRLSRIYYNGKYFNYPLHPWNVVRGLGTYQSTRLVLSHLKWQVSPYPREDTFEQWVTNRFGKRLFLTFFKAYTEKVWGVPCSELKAEWAAQRIKDLSFRTAVQSMFLLSRGTIRTLIDSFEYPRLGPGMMWSAVRDDVARHGGAVRLGSEAERILREGTRITGVVVAQSAGREVVGCGHLISSMPVSELVARLDPPAPEAVREAASRLAHRDFLTVCLILDRPQLFPDNWIYIHDPGTRAGRVQNFGAWSPDMVRPGTTCLGVEYFCFEGDDIWEMPDVEAVEMASEEMARIGLIDRSQVIDGVKVRVPKAYPMYDANYEEAVAVLREYVSGFENLVTCGRNGLHRYNNQDHSMWTAILATLNLLDGSRYDVWSVNAEAEYHEEGALVDELLNVELVG